MTSFHRQGFTPEAASDICMNQCRAGCCRGPLVLRLTPEEVTTLRRAAARLGVSLQPGLSASGGGWLKFADYPGELCPMLDPVTYACRIYAERPGRCRAFPERPTPGCAISGYS